MIGNAAEEIAAGVATALRIEPCLGHVAKLLRDPHDERHLFLIVGTAGLSLAAAFELIAPEMIPVVDPDLPNGVDHLWLAPGYGGTITLWSRALGRRHERV